VGRTLDKFLADVAALGRGNTVKLVEVKVERELTPTFFGAFNDCIKVPDNVIFGFIFVKFNIRFVNFEGTFTTDDSNAVETRSGVGKGQDISLKLPWEFF
jgi:hypothetical protein